MKNTNKKIAGFLEKGKKVYLKTEKGTNLTISLDNIKVFGLDAGIYTKKGAWGNLPAGECYFPPNEHKTNGTLVVDASIGGIGKVKNLKIMIKDGFAKKIIGTKSKQLISLLKSAKNKNAFSVAELGIGTNEKAKVTGIVLEDEKAKGTAHIAFGTNKWMGGTVDAGIHVDCVFYNPTIFIDNKQIMRNGKLLI